MATFFSGQWIGTWSGQPMIGTLTGDVSRSGNTVTLSNLNCTWTATYGSGNDPGAWFSICDGWDGWNELVRATNLSMSGGSGSKWIGSCSVNVGVSDTSHSFTFRSSDGAGIGFTVTFPSGGTAPANPTISNVIVTPTTLTATLNVSSWGNPSSGRFEYYFGTTPTTTDNYTLNPTSGYTSNLSVQMNRTGLTPDTDYYIRVRVWNSVLNNPGGFILGGPYRTRPAVKLYGSVNGRTKEVKKLYGSVNGHTKEIKKLYGSVNGQTKLVYQA